MVALATVRARLDGGLIAATPVPFDKEGNLHQPAQLAYVDYLRRQPVAGVAVWAHTGRGLMLNDETARHVLTNWRQALPEKLVIAGVGARDAHTPDDGSTRTLRMAETAARLGADALLVYPPVWLRGQADELIIEHHRRLTHIGLPLIIFYLYEAAGGITYNAEVLDQLLDLPEVVGIKMATLDSVMTYQDVSRRLHADHPEKLLITGEDRFLGYSIQRGARAALIGMGAVCCALQTELLRTHQNRDADRFLALSAAVDRLAEVLFIDPMEGYIQRILWALVHLGVIPLEAAHDPWGPKLPREEFDEIGSALADLPALTVINSDCTQSTRAQA